jgi:hypothetical protein
MDSEMLTKPSGLERDPSVKRTTKDETEPSCPDSAHVYVQYIVAAITNHLRMAATSILISTFAEVFITKNLGPRHAADPKVATRPPSNDFTVVHGIIGSPGRSR